MIQKIRSYTSVFSIILFIACLSQADNASGQVIVKRDLKIASAILNRPTNYSIILPVDYYQNQRTYPVIYLLHGFGGDNDSWLDRCNINLLIDSLLSNELISDYIYVLPDAGNSYYINNYDSSIRFEDFFIGELILHIDSVYRTNTCKEGRTLMGLSMGGFGSILMAMKYPDRFGSVVALSASVRDSAIFAGLPQSTYNIYFTTAFGPALNGSTRITEHWIRNSPYALLDSTIAEQLKDTEWYIDCGMSDERLAANEAFHDLLVRYKIPHEFHVRQGNHNWAYWYRSAIYGLIFLKGFEEKCP